MQKLRSIQVLRGVAACSVVLLHSRFTDKPDFADWSRIGSAGVDLFFVISGFIMASIPKRSPGEFLFDRFWRIYPVWLLALLPWFVAPAARETDTLIASLTLWPVFHEFTFPALSVGWTLSFEMLFYIALALSMVINWRILLALFAVGFAASFFSPAPVWDYFGNPMIFEFLFGVGVAKLPRHGLAGAILLGAGVLLMTFSPLNIYLSELAVDAPLSIVRPIYWGFPCALIVYGCLSLERWFRSSGWWLPVVLGNASYSIYLVHKLVIQMSPWIWWQEALLAIAVGVGFWLLVEVPIIGLKPRGRSKAAAPHLGENFQLVSEVDSVARITRH